MIRGWNTAASGMLAQEQRMNAISNNLANVTTTGFKQDTAILKSFPNMLLRKTQDKHLPIPISNNKPYVGSVDMSPVIGRLGTGVEVNEIYTNFKQGVLMPSSNDFDFALQGDGFFVVKTPYGERYTRNGSFTIGQEGLLVTQEGYPVLGENGILFVKENNFKVDAQGVVTYNPQFAEDPQRLVSQTENTWNSEEILDRLKIVSVSQPRYLEKEGSSLWKTTWNSGEAEIINYVNFPIIKQNFLEKSNVNPINEMVRMIEVNRAYEANQKVVQSEDDAVDRLINSFMRV